MGQSPKHISTVRAEGTTVAVFRSRTGRVWELFPCARYPFATAGLFSLCSRNRVECNTIRRLRKAPSFRYSGRLSPGRAELHTKTLYHSTASLLKTALTALHFRKAFCHICHVLSLAALGSTSTTRSDPVQARTDSRERGFGLLQLRRRLVV